MDFPGNLQACHNNNPTVVPFGAPSYIAEAITQQTSIDWTNFLFGCRHYKWKLGHEVHLQYLRSTRSSRRWVIAIIAKLQLTAWDMWQHRNSILHALSSPNVQENSRKRTRHCKCGGRMAERINYVPPCRIGRMLVSKIGSLFGSPSLFFRSCIVINR